MDASEIYSERLNAKEVIFPKEKWKIHIPSRRWTNEIRWRRSRTEIGMPINGPVIPCGGMVEYHPISAKDTSRLHQFGPKVLPGIFFGYVLYALEIWKGDSMI